MLSVVPSEVERSVSAQRFVHSKLRNRLRTDSIVAEMMIRMNQPLLNASTTPPESDPDATVELQVDLVPSVAVDPDDL